jgi:hypothetical protein
VKIIPLSPLARDQPSPLRDPTTVPPPAMPDVQCTLAKLAMLLIFELHGSLARGERFLVRSDASLGTSIVAPKASPPAELNVGLVDVGEEGLCGGLSPVPCHTRCRSPMCSQPLKAGTSVGLGANDVDLAQVARIVGEIRPLLCQWCISRWNHLGPR